MRRVGPARILDERQPVPVTDPRDPCDNQPAIDEPGLLVVDRRDAAVRVGERDLEGVPAVSLHVPWMKPIVVASEQFRQDAPETR